MASRRALLSLALVVLRWNLELSSPFFVSRPNHKHPALARNDFSSYDASRDLQTKLLNLAVSQATPTTNNFATTFSSPIIPQGIYPGRFHEPNPPNSRSQGMHAENRPRSHFTKKLELQPLQFRFNHELADPTCGNEAPGVILNKDDVA